jgi:hypothetical protein
MEVYIRTGLHPISTRLLNAGFDSMAIKVYLKIIISKQFNNPMNRYNGQAHFDYKFNWNLNVLED